MATLLSLALPTHPAECAIERREHAHAAMCASHTFGYQGFRSFAVQPCSALKPGETYEQRATKFSKMGSHIITPAQYNRVGRHSFESIVAQSTQTVQPSDYKVPDKRGVSANEKPHTPRKFLGNSTYEVDYHSYDEEMRRVVKTDLGAFEAAFHKVVAENDTSNNGIELALVPRIVTLALGDAATARIVGMFVAFFDHNHVATSAFKDRLSWEAFQAAVDHIHGSFEKELGKSCMHRSAGSTSKEEHVKVIPSTTPASSYHIDFGRYGDQPLERPYMRRRGMASTTDDLQPGTTKDTFHIPGYAGFLPRTTHNPDAVAHGEGAQKTHGRKELRLYHSDNIPGYTGHKPVDCKNYRGECRAGSEPTTSTGSAYIPHL